MDRRVFANFSAFLIEWEDLQVRGSDPTGAFGFLGNAGTAEVQGIEVEIQAHPTYNLEFTAGLMWLGKHELTEDQVSSTIVAPGRAGDELPYVRDLTANATARYNFATPLGDWGGYIGGEYSYHSEANSELDPTSRFNRVQGSYDIANIRLGAFSPSKDMDVTFYVENVFDERGDIRVRTEDSLLTFNWTNRPRTMGLDVSKRF